MYPYSNLDTPALLVDIDILQRNIEAAVRTAHMGGKRLRPHTKTHKSVDIARMQLAAGASGLTVAKLGEAEAFVDAGLNDLFIANQIVGPRKLERLMKLSERARILVAVDSIDAAEPLAAAASLRGIRIPVRLEIDTGLGRAGVRSLAEALSTARFIADQPGLEFDGIFTHEGHLYRSADRASTAHQAANTMREVEEALKEVGIACPVVSVGSTPGAALMAPEPGLTELRPGVYIFNDRTQVRLGANREQCALTVLATVTSVRPDGRCIIDAGTKTMASDCPFEDRSFGEIVDRPDLAFVGASEEHGHLQASDGPPLRVGERVRIVPNHACTCVNMHSLLYGVRGDSVVAEWPITAQGRVQ